MLSESQERKISVKQAETKVANAINRLAKAKQKFKAKPSSATRLDQRNAEAYLRRYKKDLAEAKSRLKAVNSAKKKLEKVKTALAGAKENVKLARAAKKLAKTPARKKAAQLKIERLQSRVNALTEKKREASQAVKDARK